VQGLLGPKEAQAPEIFPHGGGRPERRKAFSTKREIFWAANGRRPKSPGKALHRNRNQLNGWATGGGRVRSKGGKKTYQDKKRKRELLNKKVPKSSKKNLQKKGGKNYTLTQFLTEGRKEMVSKRAA